MLRYKCDKVELDWSMLTRNLTNWGRRSIILFLEYFHRLLDISNIYILKFRQATDLLCCSVSLFDGTTGISLELLFIVPGNFENLSRSAKCLIITTLTIITRSFIIITIGQILCSVIFPHSVAPVLPPVYT
jgi:hypothetical protein